MRLCITAINIISLKVFIFPFYPTTLRIQEARAVADPETGNRGSEMIGGRVCGGGMPLRRKFLKI